MLEPVHLVFEIPSDGMFNHADLDYHQRNLSFYLSKLPDPDYYENNMYFIVVIPETDFSKLNVLEADFKPPTSTIDVKEVVFVKQRVPDTESHYEWVLKI